MNQDPAYLPPGPADRDPQTLKDVGIVNRQTARKAGLRNPKKPRTMAVPKRRK